MRNFSGLKGVSGKRMIWGPSPGFCAANPPLAAIQPLCLPITSNKNTLVEEDAIAATSKLASRIETATYFATDPKPGELSVKGKSLSMVLGIPMQVMGYFISLLNKATL